MSYICESCIDKNRLEPSGPQIGNSFGICELCWKDIVWRHWVPVLNTAQGRGHIDTEWLERVKNRPEGDTMKSVTEAILAEDEAAVSAR